MGTNKFWSFVNMVLTICILIADLFKQDNTFLLCAIITLCLAIFFAQLELLERTSKTQDKQQDKPQTPPQRNLQGEPIIKQTK